ncbi:MAG: hypothetical protein ACYTGN_01730 [Planctomycetota bacterium]|jgi:hypothetical protein
MGLTGASTSLRWDALPPLWVIVLVIIPLVFLFVRFFYQREAGRVGRRLRISMGLLRIAAIMLVLVALWGPYQETVESQPFKRHLILAVDTSQSMGFLDDYSTNRPLEEDFKKAAGYGPEVALSGRARLRLVRDILGADRAYLEELAETFRLHVYTFDSTAAGLFEPREDEPPAEAATRLIEATQQLQPKGNVTRIGSAIRDLVRVFTARNEPVAGILMFTDGRHTGGAPEPVDEARRAADGARERISIFPVAIGNPATAVNVGVSRIDAPEVVLAGDEVSFTVHVHARGLDGRAAEIRASVLDSEGREVSQLPIESPPFNVPAEGKTERVTFRHTFHDPGTFDLKIGVTPLKGEAIKGDNFKIHVLKVAKLRMRVLLITSKPNFTYRFLSEALFRADKTIEANALLMSAEPEWPQPASRGTDSIRIFPQSRAELGQYDVIMFIDTDPTELSRGDDEQRMTVLNNLEYWVRQGGGLVLQPGIDDNLPGRYTGTPVMGLLPVVPYTRLRDDARAGIVEPRKKKRYKLTETGLLHPMMRVLKDPELVRDFWDSDDYATFYYWYAPVVRTKSNAMALAVRRDTGATEAYIGPNEEQHPLLAVQAYGLGKVLWVGTDELWRMRRGVENLYYWRFWSGAIRHLATYRLLGGNKRIKIWVDKSDGRYRVGDSIGVEAKFLDTNFEPVAPPDGNYDGFTRTIKLRTPSGEEKEITLYGVDPAGAEPEGLFRTRLHAGKEGTYRLIAEPETDEEPAEATFVVEDFSIEKLNPMLDMQTLRAVAKESGGRMLRPTEFRDLIKAEIVPRTGIVRTGDTERSDLWDRSWVLWLFVGLLGVEWILRRMNLLL